jgi:hypothetical protein
MRLSHLEETTIIKLFLGNDSLKGFLFTKFYARADGSRKLVDT